MHAAVMVARSDGDGEDHLVIMGGTGSSSKKATTFAEATANGPSNPDTAEWNVEGDVLGDVWRLRLSAGEAQWVRLTPIVHVDRALPSSAARPAERYGHIDGIEFKLVLNK